MYHKKIVHLTSIFHYFQEFLLLILAISVNETIIINKR